MRRHFFARAILALAAIGLLVAGMRGAFSAGWWQGYQVGQAAESKEGATPYWGPRGMPYGPGHIGPRAYGFRPFGFLRPLFTFALLLFLFGLIAKAFGFWAWKRAWWASGKDWHKAWHAHPADGRPADGRPVHGPRGHCGPRGRHHWPHGPMPPWWCTDKERDESKASHEEPTDEEPTEEQVAKVKPDASEQES